MRGIIKFAATGMYSGYSPVMPGTVGSLVAALIIWSIPLTWWQIVLISALSIWICGQAEKLYGETDPGKIVLDEFCGMFVAAWNLDSIPLIIAAFVLFRCFDIFKPFFINSLQTFPGGWGVVFDDLAAGFMARIIIAVYLLM